MKETRINLFYDLITKKQINKEEATSMLHSNKFSNMELGILACCLNLNKIFKKIYKKIKEDNQNETNKKYNNI